MRFAPNVDQAKRYFVRLSYTHFVMFSSDDEKAAVKYAVEHNTRNPHTTGDGKPVFEIFDTKCEKVFCYRCVGKGIFTFRRVHKGVPGLCFDCDGDGYQPETTPDAYVKAAASYYQGAQA